MADDAPIFISGRFRSGSTVLWHMFDESPRCRAYYEPCHDNLPAHIAHTVPMESHRGVGDYWESYRPLVKDLKRLHRPEFGLTRLMLDGDDRFVALRQYLEFLIEDARKDELTPVLQFNRVDFRLPWLRTRFPAARIVHIWRDARESYASMVWHLVREQFDNPARGNVFELLEWSTSLSGELPFLIGEPEGSLYERHYYLWKLSLLMGRAHADLSISYDEDVQDESRPVVDMLIDTGCLDAAERERAAGLIVPVEMQRWTLLHDADWFEAIEAKCERTLEALGLNELFGRAPLPEIRAAHPAAWAEAARHNRQRIIDQMLIAYSRQRSDVTRLLHIVREHDRQHAEPVHSSSG